MQVGLAKPLPTATGCTVCGNDYVSVGPDPARRYCASDMYFPPVNNCTDDNYRTFLAAAVPKSKQENCIPQSGPDGYTCYKLAEPVSPGYKSYGLEDVAKNFSASVAELCKINGLFNCDEIDWSAAIKIPNSKPSPLPTLVTLGDFICDCKTKQPTHRGNEYHVLADGECRSYVLAFQQMRV
jgi:hypothetical protein